MSRPLDKYWNNKNLQKIFSILLAVLLYIIVAMTSKDSRDYTISRVPVNLDLQSANLANLRLYVVEGADQYVDVTINGPRTEIPNANSPGIQATARISEISGPGTYTVPVIAASSTGDLPYTVTGYSPSSIEIRVDRQKTASFKIDPVAKGVLSPPGYVIDTERVSPEIVMVTGPEAEVQKIESASVEIEMGVPLTETYSPTLPIVLRDAQGEIIDIEEKHLTLDIVEAQLVIPVLKKTELPIEVKFTSLPRGFPEEELREIMEISPDYVSVAGRSEVIDRLTEITLAYIDIKDLRPGNNSFSYPLNLGSISEEITSVENISTVNVYFDDYTWETAEFNVQNVELINRPADFDTALLSAQALQVELVGDKDVLDKLTADDIVAEVDLSERSLTAPGQFPYPVKFSVPGKGLAWSISEHSVIVSVTEKE